MGANIPLPALQVQGPGDPTESISRLMQMKMMMDRQQLLPGELAAQQQQLRAGAQEEQIRQQQINDQQAMTKAMQEWDGKDINTLPGIAVKHGASATAVMSMKSGILKQQQDLANLTKDQLANEATQADQFLGHIDAIKGIDDPAKRAQAAQTQGQQIIAAGLHKNLDPNTAQTIQAMANGQLVPTDDQLGMYEKGLRAHSKMLDDAQKSQQTSEAEAKAAEAKANTQKTQLEAQALQKFGGMTPAMAESRYLSVQSKLNQGIPVSPDDKAFKAAYEKNKTLNTQFQFNLQNAGATAPGAGGAPSPIAQAIADGSMKWADAVSPRTPMSVKAAMLSEVKKINPNFNSGDFTVEQKVREAFTSGNYSQQLNSINRAREHMQTFLDAAKDLDGGNVQTFNRIGNMFSVEFGSDKVGNLNIAKQAFSSEVGKAFAGASVGVTDRQELDKQINAASSFSQLAGAARTADNLLAGAQKALKQTYESGRQGQPNFGTQSQGGAISVKAPNGKTYTFKDQPSADAFKQKAGIQ